jgi:Cu+-exporting ATPase
MTLRTGTKPVLDPVVGEESSTRPAQPDTGPRFGGAAPAVAERAAQPPADAEPTLCFHCGTPCPAETVVLEGKAFCCLGCRTVYSLLMENGLGNFYELASRPGTRVAAAAAAKDRWGFLDDPRVADKLLDFCDERLSRVTFHVPAIHCVACVWLLENLFRLQPGIGASQVHFARREVSITFRRAELKLSEVAGLLAAIGYEPELSLAALDKPPAAPVRRRQHLQIGIAGFAFGNIMLLSLPGYLGFDSMSEPTFERAFGWLSLALALPVLLYSAADYWRSARLSLQQRAITLDVPIALGLLAFYGQSAYEILTGRGAGYLDSFSGLVFFLLCGRLFQQKTYERLVFDRDYKGFFPLAVLRRTPDGEAAVAISELGIGDRVVLRHGELIPADATLVSGAGWIDYSFVTGESEPVPRRPGERLYAGGRQTGGAIEIEIVKPVSQSHLTTLWNAAVFRKAGEDHLQTLTNRYSRRFTWAVIALAAIAAVAWAFVEAGQAVRAFTSVLIVACPCALALVAPLTHGTALRRLARLGIFLKNGFVLERLAEADTVVFDKTGTLTAPDGDGVRFDGGALSALERAWVAAVARHSTHPYARRIAGALADGATAAPVTDFHEIAGGGIEARVAGHQVRLGSLAWLKSCDLWSDGEGLATAASDEANASTASATRVHVVLDGRYRGAFALTQRLRPAVESLIPQLAARYHLALLSGDQPRERDRFKALFGPGARLTFHQTPHGKLEFIRRLQAAGRKVVMVGDGLNDAGALKQSDVGIAVVDRLGAFSPASDVILDAAHVAALGRLLDFARASARIVRTGFAISALYNVVGISVAAAGLLSPVLCAILMPLSSVTVVLFACGATEWAARREGLTTKPKARGPTPKEERRVMGAKAPSSRRLRPAEFGVLSGFGFRPSDLPWL